MAKPTQESGLVIARKPGESFTVDGPAEIVIDELKHGRAKIRIVAPKSTTISRKELVADAPDTH